MTQTLNRTWYTWTWTTHYFNPVYQKLRLCGTTVLCFAQLRRGKKCNLCLDCAGLWHRRLGLASWDLFVVRVSATKAVWLRLGRRFRFLWNVNVVNMLWLVLHVTVSPRSQYFPDISQVLWVPIHNQKQFNDAVYVYAAVCQYKLPSEHIWYCRLLVYKQFVETGLTSSCTDTEHCEKSAQSLQVG